MKQASSILNISQTNSSQCCLLQTDHGREWSSTKHFKGLETLLSCAHAPWNTATLTKYSILLDTRDWKSCHQLANMH